MEKNIKINAVVAFHKGDYHKAFITLWELGVVEFLQYSQKENRKNKKYNWLVKSARCKKCTASSSYFWNTFILQENIFSACFTSQSTVSLLLIYYTKTTIFSEAFESKLAKEFPAVFIKAIRENEVFFREDRIGFLLKDGLLSEDYVIHQDVWESFQKTEVELWREIESIIVEIEKHPLEHILFFTVAYFETKNFDANFDANNHSVLANVYNFFIDLILRNSNIKQQTLSSVQFAIDFSKTLLKNEYPRLKKLVFKCLSLITERQTLNMNLFQLYCFNPKFEPKYIYESLCFYESPESKYQWFEDELRYKVNEVVYQDKGRVLVESQLENGGEIASKHKEDYLNNKALAYNLRAIIEILEDLKLTHFYIRDSNSKNIKVEATKVIKPIYVHAFNRLVRYYEVLKDIQNSNVLLTSNWQEACTYLVVKNKEKFQLPFVYSTQEEYIDLYSKADKEFEVETVVQVLQQFAFDRKNLRKFDSFDRFIIRYSVMDTPFLLLGDYIFSPVLFFTSFTSQNVYVNSLLKNNNRRTAMDVENVLEDLLVRHGFEVVHPSQKEVGLIDGDADLIVYDKANVLLIQCKRTNFRLDYKAQNYELIHTNVKAANQLNNAEEYLSKENTVFDVKSRKVTKWIVSNSFEKVNTEINDCLKVNYLDIVNVLNNNEGMSFKTLPDFISFFDKDTYFEVIGKEMIGKDEILKGMFSLKNMGHRTIAWKDFDLQKGNKYKHYYNKGLELNEGGNHQAAIKALTECLKLENEDFDVHSAIANVYADIRNFEKAFFHYEKALEIVPNEPLLLKNYAIRLAEFGNEKSIELTNQIFNKYPFLNLAE
ncbi:tetratricopeptide repeat protein [Flavicella sediminum]|uniref:tetratricopeptide repeat protein n=1 Tax=Flavicella sediminum TaxID=2585141 RepID=UPI00111F5714|nr:hypothetical protein [Flavicella sediminum]